MTTRKNKKKKVISIEQIIKEEMLEFMSDLSEERVREHIRKSIHDKLNHIIDTMLGIDRSWGRLEFKDRSPIAKYIDACLKDETNNYFDTITKKQIQQHLSDMKVTARKQYLAYIRSYIKRSINHEIESKAYSYSETLMDEMIEEVSSSIPKSEIKRVIGATTTKKDE